MPPVCFLRAATLQLTVCQRGQPKGEKGEGQTKPDKNRHSLPLFPLRFSPLDSPFLNPLFPHLCRFFPASLSVAQERTNPYQPVAGNNSGHCFLRKPVVFHCMSENDSQKVNAVAVNVLKGAIDKYSGIVYNICII